MTNSKHIPKRRFKEFASEDRWEKGKFLDNISQIVDFRGRTPKKLGMDWSKEGYLALSALNVKNGYIDRTVESHFGDEELYNKWMSGKDLHKNQVIFTTEAPMGNVAQIPDENKYILSQRTIAFKVEDSKITDDFLAVLLKSKNTFDSLLSLTSGGTAKGVSQKSLEELSVFIPKDLKEQSFIALYLKKFDSLITLHQHKLEKLKNLKKAYLAELFPAEGERVPKRRFPGFKGEWEEKKLGDVTTTYSGGTPTVSNKDYYCGDIPFIRSSEINSFFTELFLTNLGLEKSSAKLVKKGDILYALYGATSGEVGLSKIDGAINQAILCIVPDEKYSSDFIMQWLRFKKQNILDKFLQGGQGNLSGSIVKDIKVYFPDYLEQLKIGIFFQKLDRSISLQQVKLDKLKDLKKAYLNELFV